MTFDEMCLAVEQTSINFDIAIEKCELFIEAVRNEYITNLQEAELKVIKESGTKKDAETLKGAASEGFIERTKKAIQRIIDTVIQAFKSLGNNISAFFTKKENERTLKKIEAKIKDDPKLGSEQVETGDDKEFDKADEKIDAMYKKLYAKIKSGTATEKDVDEVNKKADEIAKMTVKVTIIASISSVVAFLTSQGSKIENYMDRQKRQLVHFTAEDLANSSETSLADMTKAVTSHAKLKKLIAIEKFNKCVKDPFMKLKQKFTGERELPQINMKVENNLSDNLNDILDQVFQEAEDYEDWKNRYSSAFLDDIEDKLDMIEESYDDDYDESPSYALDRIESMLF